MKLRDILNTTENYKHHIEQNKEVISTRWESKIDELLADESKGIQRFPKSNLSIIESTKNTISLYQKEILLATYSAGYPIPQVKEEYLKYMQTLLPVWRKDSFYIETLWALSIGIMLDVEAEVLTPLIALVEQDNPEDYLLDFLIRYYRTDWPQHDGFMFNRPYALTKKIIEAENKDKALGQLRHYIFSKWYAGHSDTGWYNLHKKNVKNHVGYWSFESGAIAKILGLDDSSLKDQQFYPYDMVHWRD